MYLLAKNAGTFDHPSLNGVMPKLPYPLELCCAGVWHSTEEKIDALKALGFHDFDFYQTLLKNLARKLLMLPAIRAADMSPSSPTNERREALGADLCAGGEDLAAVFAPPVRDADGGRYAAAVYIRFNVNRIIECVCESKIQT